ncbi:hypothetical protein [Streptomyces antibioticus]|uniref:Uncharacterized protein n=1 Tax=Streptomyces antibioticus TaxID=1890 RepID=A0AAE7CNE1_STRAT|nr:hypothetical protein [Streptomyces antibioticus]OOQ47324.1 hypothetical protein AFM16_31790 [Streptomyces antibioticus]QIT47645.1 hypothetical protein HCX60_32340 [Streptomyces antibioticus]
MPDTPTTRLSLYKSASDGSENVDYSQDIGQNLDKLDAAVGFQACTSSTRPSSPYSGKPIMETDTSYRTYFSNGSLPASASWVQIPNSGSTFNADLDLTTGKQLNIGNSSSNASLAVLATATTDDVISTRITGDTQSRYLVEADGATYWGTGTTAADTTLTRTGVGRLALTGTNAALTIGSATLRPTLSTATTLANSTTQTAIATYTIPAGDAVAGAVYRIRAWGTLGVTGTPTMTFVCKLGGAAGTTMVTFPAVTVRSGATDGYWDLDFYLACATTGGSGTWAPMAKYTHNFLTNATTYTAIGPITAAPVTRDTTTANDMVLCATWSAASASNTITCRGVAGQRIA